MRSDADRFVHTGEESRICHHNYSPKAQNCRLVNHVIPGNGEYVMLLQSIAAVTFVIKFVQHFLYVPPK